MADHTLLPLEDIDFLFARALWPDASSDDTRMLEAWIGDSQERASLVTWVRRLQGALPAAIPVQRVDAAWGRAQHRLSLSPVSSSMDVLAKPKNMTGMASHDGRTFSRHTVQSIARTLYDKLVNSAVISLFGEKTMNLSVAEIEELRKTIEHAKSKEL